MLLVARLQLQPAKDKAAPKALAALLRLMRLVLWRRPTAQQAILDKSEFCILGWLLLRLPAEHLSVSALDELEALLLECSHLDSPAGALPTSRADFESHPQAVVPGPPSCWVVPGLRHALMQTVLCDFRIWSRAQVEVQLAHLQLLRKVVKVQVSRAFLIARTACLLTNLAARTHPSLLDNPLPCKYLLGSAEWAAASRCYPLSPPTSRRPPLHLFYQIDRRWIEKDAFC